MSVAFGVEASHCTGHFVNPVKDVCWRCLFPLSIGGGEVVKGPLPDTKNAASPVGWCPTALGERLGLNIGFWEPQALVDVTDTPYCLVNLGGHQVNLGHSHKRGGRQHNEQGEVSAFYHVHWYKYPLLTWLNLITSVGCVQGGDFDIAYLTELDPLWSDSEMSFVLNPEAALFANPIAQTSCAADSLSSTLHGVSLDALFWCAGSQGSHYPLTGHVSAPLSPVQIALLLTERLNYKLHREPALITDSSPRPGEICKEHHYPIVPKSRYRYEMVNQVADGKHCYPTGASTLTWEEGKIKPHTESQYGFLVWKKRNCTFL
ncbi:MAG: conjugal transfer pilus assembly protein TraU [Pseudomonadota bacterium]